MRRRGVKSQDEEQKERLRILTESDLERHFFEENVEGIKQHSSKSKIALRRFVPVSIWFPEYQRSKFLRDLTLGLTLAFVIAPKAMAHALPRPLPAPVTKAYLPFKLYFLRNIFIKSILNQCILNL